MHAYILHTSSYMQLKLGLFEGHVSKLSFTKPVYRWMGLRGNTAVAEEKEGEVVLHPEGRLCGPPQVPDHNAPQNVTKEGNGRDI
jgi:hypothetical protein